MNENIFYYAGINFREEPFFSFFFRENIILTQIEYYSILFLALTLDSLLRHNLHGSAIFGYEIFTFAKINSLENVLPPKFILLRYVIIFTYKMDKYMKKT